METETEKHPRNRKAPKMALCEVLGTYREGRADAETRAGAGKE